MERMMLLILNMGMMAGWMVLVVIILRLVFGKMRVPGAIRLILWGLVAVRLILPFSIESRYSLMPGVSIISEGMIDVQDYQQVQEGERLLANEDAPAWQQETQEQLQETQGQLQEQPSWEQAENLSKEQNPQTLDLQTEQDLQAQNTQAAVNTSLSVGQIATRFSYVWAAGVVGMLLYALFSVLSLHKKVSVRMPYMSYRGSDGGKNRAGIYGRADIGQRGADVYLTDGIDTPFILGILRPVIYLPSLGKGDHVLTEREYELILAHEQSHIRNLDHLWKPLGFLLLSIYWFQPLLWVAYILFSRDIEFACDERVIRRLATNKVKDYMETLLKCSNRGAGFSACPLAFGEVGVKQRIKAVWDYKKPAFWIVSVGIIACIAVAVTMLTTQKQDKGLDEIDFTAEASVWAEAVIQRDWDTISMHCTEEVLAQMKGTLSDNPWPMPEQDASFVPYQIAVMGDGHGIINYYAYDTAPVICVRTERIRLGMSGEDAVVVEEGMIRQDRIADGSDYGEAYLFGINNTALNYIQNGQGDALLARYRAHDSAYFETLGNPRSAAYTLLHLDPNEAQVDAAVSGDVAACSILLPAHTTDGARNGDLKWDIQMVRYGGEDGIWIPQDSGTKAIEAAELSEVIRNISVDLTGDGVEDQLVLYYDDSYEAEGGSIKTSYEERVADYIGVVIARVTDGVTGKVLFEQSYAASHSANGILALVKEDGQEFLLTGNCYEISGEAGYAVKVLRYEGDMPVIREQYEGAFPYAAEAVVRGILREQEQGEPYTFQNSTEVIPALQKIISHYEEGSELLIACDAVLDSYVKTKTGNVFLGEREGAYTLEDYYQYIWKRHICEYTVEYLAENLYGRNIFCVKESNRLLGQRIYFYDAQTGEKLAESWGGSIGGSVWFVDLDRDGKNEMIADTVASGDGGRDLLIYREKDGKVMTGSGCDLLEDEIKAAYEAPGGANIGIWTVYGEYLPETNQIKVYYWNPDQARHDSRIYDIDLDRITFYEFIPLPE